MTAQSRKMLVVCGVLLVSMGAASQQPHREQKGTSVLERDFKLAAADYDSHNFAAAAALLERLQVAAPKSFEVHELLGLSYAAQARDSKAVEQMRIATQLRPDVVAARTNLAAGLMRLGTPEPARTEYLEALRLDPKNYTANRGLASLYLRTNRIPDALPLLEAAHDLRPDVYDNGYDLALAYLLSGRLTESRGLVGELMKQKNSGELHNLLGRIDEKEGTFVAAANEFETAARIDPSEDNLFIWASELLLHRTYIPAIDVFTEAAKRYPKSPRLLIGLGMTLYARGENERSIRALISAADLDPHDPRCYLFLSKAYLSSPVQAEDVIERFRRYAQLEPSNAMAQYYYALSLWKGRRLESHEVEYRTVETLLQKSIALDGSFAEAHLQLGILYTDQHEFEKSLPEYQKALQLNPSLPDAHFRLGRYYFHEGEKEKAQAELDIFKKLQNEHHAETDKAKAEVQQFVVSAGTSPGAPAAPAEAGGGTEVGAASGAASAAQP